MNNTPQASPSLLSEEITPDLVRDWILQNPVGLDQLKVPERCRFETFLVHTLAAVLSDPEIFLGIQQRVLRIKAERKALADALAPRFAQPPRAFQGIDNSRQCGERKFCMNPSAEGGDGYPTEVFNGDQQRA